MPVTWNSLEVCQCQKSSLSPVQSPHPSILHSSHSPMLSFFQILQYCVLPLYMRSFSYYHNIYPDLVNPLCSPIFIHPLWCIISSSLTSLSHTRHKRPFIFTFSTLTNHSTHIRYPSDIVLRFWSFDFHSIFNVCHRTMVCAYLN